LSEVRKRLEQKPLTEPGEATQTDRCFEAGVKSFEAGNYAEAIAWFHNALELAPDDIVLPFAYVQAFFANDEYKKAAEVLRTTLSEAPPEEEGVFYPRGLYPDDNVLNGQIKQLSRAVRLNPFDANLQLLLGYQLLGMGRLDEAAEPLQKAQQDSDNHQAATLLMSLLEKLKNADEK